MNGDIDIETSQGAGSAFTVKIPEMDSDINDVAFDDNEMFFGQEEWFGGEQEETF